MSDSGILVHLPSAPPSLVGTTPDSYSLPASEDDNGGQDFETNDNSGSSIARPARHNTDDARKRQKTWLKAARLYFMA